MLAKVSQFMSFQCFWATLAKGTLSNIKLAGADADRLTKLASRLSTHAQKSMQSIIQSRRAAGIIPQKSAQFKLV